MVKFPHVFDSCAFELLKWAPSDWRAAQKALAHAANYLKQNEPLPDPLQKWIADAFEVAAAKDSNKEAARALGEELHLTAKNRRPTADPFLVAWDISELMEGKVTYEEAVAQVAEIYGIKDGAAKRFYGANKDVIKKVKIDNDEMFYD